MSSLLRLGVPALLLAAFLPVVATAESAATAPTRYVEVEGRRLAYRSIGQGRPLVLCNRFRGTLDTWDPAFLDGLAREFRVIIFDFRGLSRSTGAPPASLQSMADDVRDLVAGLRLGRIALGGWSLGGLVAQTVATEYPELVSHLVVIGAGPPGPRLHGVEPVFLERAHKPVNDLPDEYVLFFEPASASSRRAADESHVRIAQRRTDPAAEVAPEAWPGLHQAGAEFLADKHGTREKFRTTTIPILLLCGDHDIVFPVENWFALNRLWPTARLVVFPAAGHGPQHQYVDASVHYIAEFARNAPAIP